MRLQSFVVGSDEIELSLGTSDGGREYLFVRFPLPEQDFSNQSLDKVRLLTLQRAGDAIGAEIERLNTRLSEAV
jgi:hypothetical protein